MEIKHNILRTLSVFSNEKWDFFAMYFPAPDLAHICFKWFYCCAFSPLEKSSYLFTSSWRILWQLITTTWPFLCTCSSSSVPFKTFSYIVSLQEKSFQGKVYWKWPLWPSSPTQTSQSYSLNSPIKRWPYLNNCFPLKIVMRSKKCFRT